MLTTYIVILVSILIVTFAIIAGVLIILVHNHILNTSKKNYTLIEEGKYDDVDLGAFATEKRIKRSKEKKINIIHEKKKEPEIQQKNKEVKKDIENDLRSRLQEELFKVNPSANQSNNYAQSQSPQQKQSTAFTNSQIKTNQQSKEDEYFKRIAEERRRVAAQTTQQRQFQQQVQVNMQTQFRPNATVNTMFSSDSSRKNIKQSKRELENDLQAKLLKAKSELNKTRNNG